MTAKEYLSQAFWIDVGIGSKLDQLERLNALATRATTTFSEVPFTGTPNPHRTEDIIIKIIALEDTINGRTGKEGISARNTGRARADVMKFQLAAMDHGLLEAAKR